MNAPAQIGLDHPEFTEARRSVALASDAERLETFQREALRLYARAGRDGDLEHADVADVLQEIARCHGMRLREDEVRNVIAMAAQGQRAIFTPDAGNANGHGEAGIVPVSPLEFIRASAWEGQPVPSRQWLVKGRVPMADVTRLSGDGGTGKTTIALQLCASTVRGTDWLGASIETPGPAVFFSAEEDEDEVHRRLANIIAHHEISWRDLDQLHLRSFANEDAALAVGDGKQLVRPTPLFQQVETAICNLRPALVVVDTAADVFPVDENNRAQARQCISLLRRLAMRSGAALMLLSHPSLWGLNSGSGTSGTTGWSNSQRSRLYLTSSKAKDVDAESLSELRVMKANYGPTGEIVRLRRCRGVYVPDYGAPSLEKMASETRAENKFMALLDLFTEQGRSVGVNPGKNFAPAVFAAHPSAEGYQSGAFKDAMERLLTAGKIRVEVHGPPSKRVNVLVRVST